MNINSLIEKTEQLRLCPVCSQPFLSKVEGNEYIVWCGYGPCKSPNSNNGFGGRTLLEAWDKAHDEIIYPDNEVMCENCGSAFHHAEECIYSFGANPQ